MDISLHIHRENVTLLKYVYKSISSENYSLLLKALKREF
jgi:hypothetical protein